MFKLELFPIESAAGEEYVSDRRVFSHFLQSHRCYDMVPASGKIVVLHTALTVNAAFHALIENGTST
jgi:5'-AMP-activated protein kinase, regulatory gamma subunit